MRVLKGPCFKVLARLREHLNSPGNSTMRGSGDHQRMGCCAEYQGKIPRSYAASNRAAAKTAASINLHFAVVSEHTEISALFALGAALVLVLGAVLSLRSSGRVI